MRILIIDISALCHAASYAMPPLKQGENGTGIIYNFMIQLLRFQRIYDADRIVFAKDSKQSKREEIFPEYKAQRKLRYSNEGLSLEEIEQNKQVARQFKIIPDEFLPSLGFVNVFGADGYEGDDVIARICQSYNKDQIIIVANDKDLFQLIRSNCRIYYLRERQLITEEEICSRYKIHPSRFAEMKSLAGCSSDEVPGVPGVAEKTAIKYMCGDLKTTSKIYQKIKASEDVIKFTEKLVKLPFEGTPEFVIKPDTCLENKFLRTFRKLGFKSFMEREFMLDVKLNICDRTGGTRFIQ